MSVSFLLLQTFGLLVFPELKSFKVLDLFYSVLQCLFHDQDSYRRQDVVLYSYIFTLGGFVHLCRLFKDFSEFDDILFYCDGSCCQGFKRFSSSADFAQELVVFKKESVMFLYELPQCLWNRFFHLRRIFYPVVCRNGGAASEETLRVFGAAEV